MLSMIYKSAVQDCVQIRCGWLQADPIEALLRSFPLYWFLPKCCSVKSVLKKYTSSRMPASEAEQFLFVQPVLLRAIATCIHCPKIFLQLKKLLQAPAMQEQNTIMFH